mgnify:CR=1 FL=1
MEMMHRKTEQMNWLHIWEMLKIHCEKISNKPKEQVKLILDAIFGNRSNLTWCKTVRKNNYILFKLNDIEVRNSLLSSKIRDNLPFRIEEHKGSKKTTKYEKVHSNFC